MSAGPKILVVDDTPQVVDFYCLLLRRMGCVPISAANGEDALKYLKNAATPFAVIILDLLLPGISGWETLLKIRESEKHRDTPVIVITGLDLPEEQRARLSEHCQGIMRKTDFHLTAIRDLINKMLEISPEVPPDTIGNSSE